MNFYFKRDLSDSPDCFLVYDNLGQLCYKFSYSRSNPMMKYSLRNTDNQKNGRVTVVPLPALKAFSVTADNRTVRLVINTSNKEVFCYFYGIGWSIRGSLLSHCYEILDVDNSVIATHTRSFSNGGDVYQLNVNRSCVERMCICISLCLDMINTVDNTLIQAV